MIFKKYIKEVRIFLGLNQLEIEVKSPTYSNTCLFNDDCRAHSEPHLGSEGVSCRCFCTHNVNPWKQIRMQISILKMWKLVENNKSVETHIPFQKDNSSLFFFFASCRLQVPLDFGKKWVNQWPSPRLHFSLGGGQYPHFAPGEDLHRHSSCFIVLITRIPPSTVLVSLLHCVWFSLTQWLLVGPSDSSWPRFI